MTKSPIVATESRGLRGNEALPATIAKKVFLVAIVRRWYWRSSLRVLVDELRNLIHRMRLALEIREWERRGNTGPAPALLEWTRGNQCRNCRPVYISYMQQQSRLRPSLTVVDSHLESQAWWAGWRSARHIDRQQHQHKCSSCSPMGGNSMPPSAVQQSSKHDPSIPLPSQG